MRILHTFVAVALSVFMLLTCSTDNDPDYTLTTSTEPPAAGIVTPSHGGFHKGTEVEISATANENMVFSGWRGDFMGSENPTVITMNSNKNLIAFFFDREYPLNIHIEGEGDGSVAEQVVQQKSTDYEYGILVELTAHPADGWVFSGWDVDLEGNKNPETINIEQEAGVTATFKPVAEILALRVQGDGTIDIEQIDSDENPSKNRVRLTARPNDGWWFAEWQGDVTGSDNPVEIILHEEIAVNAVFEIREYPLTIHTEGEGNVEEQVVQQRATDYEEGTIVELTANPEQGWEFIKWKGDITGSGNPKQIIINGPKVVTAVFAEEAESTEEDEEEEEEEITYNLAINIQGEGSVNISPQQNEYEPGTTVTLTATPSEGWEFDQWEGGLTGTENPTSITMESSAEITALFIEQETAFSGGDGSSGNPYQISTVEQLQAISDFLSSHFIQINNISAASTSGWNGGQGFSPIGSSSNPFTGTFNGNGFEISALTIDRNGDENVGLFGFTGSAQINNTGLLNVNIIGENIVGEGCTQTCATKLLVSPNIFSRMRFARLKRFLNS